VAALSPGRRLVPFAWQMRPSTLIGKVLSPDFGECETARAGISKQTGKTIRKAWLGLDQSFR